MRKIFETRNYSAVQLEIRQLEKRLAHLRTMQKHAFRRATRADNLGLTNHTGVYVCSRCRTWTANVRDAKHGVCGVPREE